MLRYLRRVARPPKTWFATHDSVGTEDPELRSNGSTGSPDPEVDFLSVSSQSYGSTGSPDPEVDLLSVSSQSYGSTGSPNPEVDLLSVSSQSYGSTGSPDPEVDLLSVSSESFENGWIYSRAMRLSEEKYEPDPSPCCEICMDLAAAALPLTISLSRLKMLLRNACSACNMLHGVLQLWNGSRIDRISMEIEIKSSSAAMIISIYDIGLELWVNTLDDRPCPWPSLPKRPRVWGIESSDTAKQKISDWLHTCTTSHVCGNGIGAKFLPKRVLEIQDHHEVRLRLTCEHEEGVYICLSHCWGGIVPLQLTALTLETFQEAIPWSDLPRTFQDAIDITWKLGFRFIWIDSLCILQNDLDDWREEGGKMAAIYSGAHLTLAATASANSSGGLYNAVTPSDTDSRMVSLFTEDSSGYTREFPGLDGEDAYSIRVMKSSLFPWKQLPLQQRAWYFQEWLLSTRIVHFADSMLYWECAVYGEGEDGSPVDSQFSYAAERRSTFVSLGEIPSPPLDLLKKNDHQTFIWHCIVSSYSELQLSYPLDIFPALQGVASRVAANRHSRYHAGLWEDNIIADLLWSAVGQRRDPTDEYRAPSWSWASAETIIWHDFPWAMGLQYQSVFLPEVSVTSITTQTVTDNPFGQVLNGRLVLKGLCLPAIWWGSKLVPLTSRTELPGDSHIFMPNKRDPTIRWDPDYRMVLAPDCDLTMMLMGSWPREMTAHEPHKAVYQSWFLAFECIDPVEDLYKRRGILHTGRLAYRARFLRNAIERTLTII